MVEAAADTVRMQCKERTKVFDVDRRIAEMSPLFTDMWDSLNEQSDCVELDFADEASFARVLEFCSLLGY